MSACAACAAALPHKRAADDIPLYHKAQRGARRQMGMGAVQIAGRRGQRGIKLWI